MVGPPAGASWVVANTRVDPATEAIAALAGTTAFDQTQVPAFGPPLALSAGGR